VEREVSFMQMEKSINGVNVDRLMDTVEIVKEKPDAAQFKFKATNYWVNGGHNRTVLKDFYGACQTQKHKKPFTLEEDEPQVLLGEDYGANPVEYVLSALAGCLTTTLVYHAAVRGIKIDEIESTYEGELDLRGFLGVSKEVRNGYNGIKVTFKIKADASEKTLRELVELAQKRSPVFDIVTNPVSITVELESKQLLH
jgi:uncharacterized OsmC-like protein